MKLHQQVYLPHILSVVPLHPIIDFITVSTELEKLHRSAAGVNFTTQRRLVINYYMKVNLAGDPNVNRSWSPPSKFQSEDWTPEVIGVNLDTRTEQNKNQTNQYFQFWSAKCVFLLLNSKYCVLWSLWFSSSLALTSFLLVFLNAAWRRRCERFYKTRTLWRGPRWTHWTSWKHTRYSSDLQAPLYMFILNLRIIQLNTFKLSQ